jgi:hypothetical protein
MIRESIIQARHASPSENLQVLAEKVVRKLWNRGHVIPRVRIERLMKAACRGE